MRSRAHSGGGSTTPGTHFYQADDEDAFAVRVVQCLQDEAAARAMGQAARRYVRDRFSWERATDVFAQFGEQLIAAQRQM